MHPAFVRPRAATPAATLNPSEMRQGIADPPLQIADCLALFALLEHALDDGTPLPPTMPIFERLAYHRVGARERRRANDGHTNRVWHEVFPNDDESKDIMVEEESKALSQLGERLTRDTLKVGPPP